MIMYEFFMNEALIEAKKAMDIDEVPIGAIVVFENKIIGRGYNRRNSKKNSLYHGEIIAINQACEFMGDWRLEGCSLFVTVEPCPMCAGAILQSRIDELIFGTQNKKAGSCGSIINLMSGLGYNHEVDVVENVLHDECSMIMKDFFAQLRNKNKKNL